MGRKEVLEEKCSELFGKETDIGKRLDILKDAFWQANNSGYCNSMASRLMSGHEDSQTEYWSFAVGYAARLPNYATFIQKSRG